MKLGPVTKLDKRNKTTSKKFEDDFMSANCDVIDGGRIPDADSVKLTFSLTVTFYLTKRENITKKYFTQLSYRCFE